MNLKYMSSVVFVKDMDRSKRFYTEIFDQKIIQDYGRYVGFEGGFGIWEKEYALSIIFPEQSVKSSNDFNQMELYFETEDLDDTIKHLKSLNVSFIHELHTHDWGQRSVRVLDPDGTIIEISEPIATVIHRFFQQGLDADQIAEKTGMPLSEIKTYQ
ncbi:VOC family protein [bacterium]